MRYYIQHRGRPLCCTLDYAAGRIEVEAVGVQSCGYTRLRDAVRDAGRLNRLNADKGLELTTHVRSGVCPTVAEG